jgi:hypothetical protein
LKRIFLKHRPIGFLVYFPLKLGGAFTTLLFSFCIGIVLNMICIMTWSLLISNIPPKSVMFSVTRPTPFPGFQDFLHSSSDQKPLCDVVVILGVESERREECCFWRLHIILVKYRYQTKNQNQFVWWCSTIFTFLLLRLFLRVLRFPPQIKLTTTI